MLRLVRRRVGLEEREFLAALVRRAPGLDESARFDLMEEAGQWYRERLELRDLPLSGEQIVRGLAAALFAGEVSRARYSRSRAGSKAGQSGPGGPSPRRTRAPGTAPKAAR